MPTPNVLIPEQLAFYREEGYLLLKGVFETGELTEFTREIDSILRHRADLVHADNMRARFRPHHLTSEPVFEVFDPIADLSPFAWSIAHDQRIRDRLHDLYGEPACLFKDKLIYKLPGATGTTLHQDWISWPDFPKSFLTVVLPLDSFDESTGATEVFPGCHHQGYLSPKDGQHHYVELSDLPADPVPLNMEPGDMAIFGCFLPHRSAANVSNHPRRGYFISYNAESDGGDQYQKHYPEYHAWIRNKTPEPRRSQLYFR
jgi:ectoine hydroxylase-related dioxygenase (phytanoyl-CoA dioxygenase family)